MALISVDKSSNHVGTSRREPALLALLLGALQLGCMPGTDTGKECSKEVSELAALCPVNMYPKLRSEASGKCEGDGSYKGNTSEGELGGTCESSGSCEFVCVATGDSCPCGISRISRDSIDCRECDAGCGDGACSGRETENTCPVDCGTEPGSTGGSSGSGGSGSGGTSGDARAGSAGAGNSEGPESSGGGSGGSSEEEPEEKCAASVNGTYVIRTD